jgi:hypothetical protein
VLSSKVEGESVLMSVESNSYYKLSEVGSSIWELLEKPLALSELIARLTERYEVSEEQCAAEVLPFLDQLVRNGLVCAD